MSAPVWTFTSGWYGLDPVYGQWVRVTTDAPQVSVEIPHDASRYPHKCPSCGKHAYVGLTAVEHEHDAPCD